VWRPRACGVPGQVGESDGRLAVRARGLEHTFESAACRGADYSRPCGQLAEVPRQEMVKMLRKAGMLDAAEEVESLLPDPLNGDDAARPLGP